MQGLSVFNLTKIYPGGVKALDNVTASFPRGAITALLGENGAGKTTLLKIVSGREKPTRGRMILNGVPYNPSSPTEALRMGVYMAAQEPTLFPGLRAYEDLLVTLRIAGIKSSLGEALRILEEAMDETGLKVDPYKHVDDMSFAEKQRLEALKAVAVNADVILLDEPTTHLSPVEAGALLDAAKTLAEDGRSVVIVTHRIREALDVADHLVVLRRGEKTFEGKPPSSVEDVANLMFGDTGRPRITARRRSAGGRILLEVSNVSLPPRLRGVSLRVGTGIIVGVAGVAGNGQEELFRVLAGLEKPAAGRILFDGFDITGLKPLERRRMGMTFIPDQRLGWALVPGETLTFNMALSHKPLNGGVIVDWGLYEEKARAAVRLFNVKAEGPDTVVDGLSGGNMQKFILAREVGVKPRLLIAMNPAAGLDLNAKVNVARALESIAMAGGSVIVIDEDLEFLEMVSDIVYVMTSGVLTGPYEPADEKSITLAMGGS